jgi:hypothetical protein
MLIRAQRGPANAAQPIGTSGTDATVKETTYRLDADVDTLNPHVGHKVEITGTLQAPTAPTADSVEPLSPANAPRLKVDHVKMVDETCGR